MTDRALSQSALSGAVAVIGTAARLWWRHWPVLMTLFLSGVIAHELLLRAAVRASAWHAILGFLILLLAPLAILTAFILMLRALKPSLPTLARATSAPAADGPAPRPGLFGQVGSVLAPFLAVYVSYGHLREDLSEYSYRVWLDETLDNPQAFTNPASIDVLARMPFSVGASMLGVVVVAFALRWAVDRWGDAKRRPWLGLPATYAEVVWIALGGVAVLEVSDVARGWLEARRVVRVLYDGWYAVTGVFGPLTGPLRDGGSWLWQQVSSSANAVIVIPVAWLVVGAVVYGYRIAGDPPAPEELRQRSMRRWPSLPAPAHVVGGQVGALLIGRFGALLYGLRLVFRAGLVPMLLFCLAFIVVGSAGEWLWELERATIGARDLQTFWMPWSGPLDTANTVLSWMMLACLLGAAIDWVLRTRQPSAPAPTAGGAASPTVSAGRTAEAAWRP